MFHQIFVGVFSSFENQNHKKKSMFIWVDNLHEDVLIDSDYRCHNTLKLHDQIKLNSVEICLRNSRNLEVRIV